MPWPAVPSAQPSSLGKGSKEGSSLWNRSTCQEPSEPLTPLCLPLSAPRGPPLLPLLSLSQSQMRRVGGSEGELAYSPQRPDHTAQSGSLWWDWRLYPGPLLRPGPAWSLAWLQSEEEEEELTPQHRAVSLCRPGRTSNRRGKKKHPSNFLSIFFPQLFCFKHRSLIFHFSPQYI